MVQTRDFKCFINSLVNIFPFKVEAGGGAGSKIMVQVELFAPVLFFLDKILPKVVIYPSGCKWPRVHMHNFCKDTALFQSPLNHLEKNQGWNWPTHPHPFAAPTCMNPTHGGQASEQAGTPLFPLLTKTILCRFPVVMDKSRKCWETMLIANNRHTKQRS